MAALSEQEIYDRDYVHRIRSENLDLPNPCVPLTIGAMITLIGLASLRWLNDGEFVLFAPSTTYTSQSYDESLQSGLEEEPADQQTSNVPSLEKEDQMGEYNETSSSEHGSDIDQS